MSMTANEVNDPVAQTMTDVSVESRVHVSQTAREPNEFPFPTTTIAKGIDEPVSDSAMQRPPLPPRQTRIRRDVSPSPAKDTDSSYGIPMEQPSPVSAGSVFKRVH